MTDLAKSTQAARTRDIRARVLPDAGPQVASTPTHHNEAWDRDAQFGTASKRFVPEGLRGALDKAIESESMSESIQDSMIYEMRLSGMPIWDIAAKLGPPVTEKMVAERLQRLFERMEKQTAAEMKMLQLGRVEAILRMTWNRAMSSGDLSPAYLEVILKSLERINKMFELESEKTRVVIEIVSTEQANLIYAVTQMVTEGLVRAFNVQLAKAGAPELDPDVVEGTVGELMGAAGAMITEAQHSPLTAERKAGELVVQRDRQ